MINKDEFVEVIENEMGLWQNYYNQVDLYLYPMIAACFRAGATYIINEDEKEHINGTNILSLIEECLNDIEDDKECLDRIYSLVITHMGDGFLKELIAEGSGKELATLTIDQALQSIVNELGSKEQINFEAKVALRTLQWMKDKLVPTDLDGQTEELVQAYVNQKEDL